MKHTVSAGGIVINALGQILVVNQQGKSWSLPKGHVEAGEELREAAEREIQEESGVSQLVFIKKLGSYTRERIDDPTELKTIHMFLFSTKEMGLHPSDPENPEARWVDKDEVAQLLTAEKDKAFFEKWKEQLE